MGTTIGVIKGGTRSLDYSSYEEHCILPCKGLEFQAYIPSPLHA